MNAFDRTKPYELGLRVNGKLECVYQFSNKKDRENFKKQNPLPQGQIYEEHDKLL